jgi:type VI secretion system secreted protein VgrG
LSIVSGDELGVKTGDSTITVKKDGDLVLKGKNLSADASGKINIKASGEVLIKGQKISQN